MNRVTGWSIDLLSHLYEAGVFDKATLQAALDYLLYEPEPEEDLTAKAVDEAMESPDHVKVGEYELLKTGKMVKQKK